MNIFLVGAVTVADEKQLAKYKTYMELIQNVKGLETFTNPVSLLDLELNLVLLRCMIKR